jgi:hypothetical protein
MNLSNGDFPTMIEETFTESLFVSLQILPFSAGQLGSSVAKFLQTRSVLHQWKNHKRQVFIPWHSDILIFCVDGQRMIINKRQVLTEEMLHESDANLEALPKIPLHHLAFQCERQFTEQQNC